MANAEPIVGAQRPGVQSLHWFLSESTWDAAAVNARRVALLRRYWRGWSTRPPPPALPALLD